MREFLETHRATIAGAIVAIAGVAALVLLARSRVATAVSAAKEDARREIFLGACEAAAAGDAELAVARDPQS